MWYYNTDTIIRLRTYNYTIIDTICTFKCRWTSDDNGVKLLITGLKSHIRVPHGLIYFHFRFASDRLALPVLVDIDPYQLKIIPVIDDTRKYRNRHRNFAFMSPTAIGEGLFTRINYYRAQQELSYRKQIARQLRTQYVEGIYRPKYYTVTLKCRLMVTQGHWKRNHWIDHTWLIISRVIWRWILSWPWNVG